MSKKELLRVRALTWLHVSGGGVKGATFEIGPRQLVALVGPNGSGKTTLLAALSGLASSKGEAVLAGVSIKREDEYRRNLDYLPENRGFPGFLTPRVVVRLASAFWLQQGLWDAFIREAERLDFPKGQLDVPIDNLSQGTKEKLALALCFARSARLYLLDEPEAHLDPIVRDRLEKRLEDLRAEGRAVLLATHDVHLAVRIADAILLIRDGIVRSLGRAERVLDALAEMEVDDGWLDR